jgi:hypothetical protein
MPYSVRRREGKHCVYKQGSSTPVPGGCHPSREAAIRHMRALYAAEASSLLPTLEATMTTTSTNFVPELSTTAAPSSITIRYPKEEHSEEEVSLRWQGILTLEGLATGDGRYFAPEAWSWRDPPLTLMAQTVNEEGHKGAEVAGRIERIWKEERPDLGEGVVAVMGEGEFDTAQFGREIARMVKEGTLSGVSVDFGVQEAALRDPESGEIVDPQDLELADVLFGNLEHAVLKAEIGAATVVPMPAFKDAAIALTASIWTVSEVLTASAAGLAPLKPRREWFETPEPDLPTPLTVSEEGRLYGHLALWGQCHTGFPHCETPPRSASDYSYFHLGEIETEEGDTLSVGRITVGDLGHAPISYDGERTMEHYDNSGCVAAFVKAHDGQHGIWLSGAVRSDLPAEKVRDLRANPPSGDWRRAESGGLELRGILAVPVPGFPVPRSEMRLLASGAEQEEVEALVASGYVPEEEEAVSRSDYLERKYVEQIKAELAWERDGLQFSAEERRKMARSGVALDDGSFPIPDCDYAERAIRSQGRADPSKRESVRRHIRKRVRTLGCSGDIFDDYK